MHSCSYSAWLPDRDRVRRVWKMIISHTGMPRQVLCSVHVTLQSFDALECRVTSYLNSEI